MLSVFDQENLTSTHASNAANKPLNQGLRALQQKTPGPSAAKTPFRTPFDENASVAAGKSGKNAFVTPAPRTNRAPLGAKTTNAKAQVFQTPAAKPLEESKNTNRSTAARRTVKKKIYVEPEPLPAPDKENEEDEPDFGFAPPNAIPLPDPPLDFNALDQTYPELSPRRMNRDIIQHHFQSPKDENGFSLSLTKQDQYDKLSLERDLAHLLVDDKEQDIETDVPVKQGLDYLPVSARVNSVKARSAAINLSQTSQPRTHLRLPSAATRETAASKQKRKPLSASATRSIPTPIANATIGFPKARKPTSILPASMRNKTDGNRVQRAPLTTVQNGERCAPVSEALISPRKFTQLYGEPDAESGMWLRLKELEVNDRRRDADHKSSSEDSIFDLEIDSDLDDQIAAQSGLHDEFELRLEDL